jgi:hypothetical protein
LGSCLTVKISSTGNVGHDQCYSTLLLYSVRLFSALLNVIGPRPD